MAVSDKLVRLNQAKEDIQEALETTNEKIEEYASVIERYVNNQATTTSSGECGNALEVPCKTFTIEGNSIQEGTPTATNPIDIQVLTGTITITQTNGTETRTYQANLGDNYLAKAGDIRDKLVIGRNGKVKVEKNVGKKTINSSEVKLGHSYTNVIQYSVDKPSDYKHYNDYYLDTNILCTSANSTNPSWSFDDISQIGAINAGAMDTTFWIGFEANTTLDAAKSELDGSEIYYELSTPQTIELDNIEPIEMFEGTNNFSISSNTDIEVEYITKVE